MTDWQDAQRAARSDRLRGIFVGVTSSSQDESESEPSEDTITKQSPCIPGGAQFSARLFLKPQTEFLSEQYWRMCC